MWSTVSTDLYPISSTSNNWYGELLKTAAVTISDVELAVSKRYSGYSQLSCVWEYFSYYYKQRAFHGAESGRNSDYVIWTPVLSISYFKEIKKFSFKLIMLWMYPHIFLVTVSEIGAHNYILLVLQEMCA